MSVMAQLNQFHSFHQSSLPNGKIDWEWIEIEEQWAPSGIWIVKNEQFNKARREEGGLEWIGFGVGYGRHSRTATSPKRRQAQPVSILLICWIDEWIYEWINSNKSIKRWDWRKRVELVCFLFLSGSWWSEMESMERKEKSKPMEPNPRSQKLRGKLFNSFTLLMAGALRPIKRSGRVGLSFFFFLF